jgi:hypothetical protein
MPFLSCVQKKRSVGVHPQQYKKDFPIPNDLSLRVFLHARLLRSNLKHIEPQRPQSTQRNHPHPKFIVFIKTHPITQSIYETQRAHGEHKVKNKLNGQIVEWLNRPSRAFKIFLFHYFLILTIQLRFKKSTIGDNKSHD